MLKSIIKNTLTGFAALILFLIAADVVEYRISPENYASRRAARQAKLAAEAAAAASAATPTAQAAPSEGAGLSDINLTMLQLNKTGFGNVLEVTMSITNRNRYPIKDVTVTCKHAASSGSIIDSNTRTVYQSIQAGSSTIVRDFNMGFINNQTDRSACGITDF